MRMRLFTALFLLGTALAALLGSSLRVPAGEIIVPTLPRCVRTDNVMPLPIVRCETGSPAPRVPTLLVNSRKVRLNYNISDVGPSGVSAVELWATRDGQTWQRYSNEPPPAGPLVVQVAEEGRYGFTIVVRNGLGLSSPAPQTGEAPQLWVEVDETKPAVKIHEVEVGRGCEEGTVTVQYTASDANLCGKPVTISMSTERDGPYKPIARGLENTGKYVWQFPRDLPYQVYLKVAACDRAGNVGCDGTLEPIKIDLSRPRGTILGVDQDKKASCEDCDEQRKKAHREQLINFYMGFTR